ncbi:putative Splicing factor U2AF 50 kDa subunit [Blattamonas nauphoetae]|uniref:Splicing factor U2AF 50 kDa subunit n=1 Tax=Blattamonas nauphoetae TaxID=2049346 RepID=A0ABQ9YLX0_9EUKA|nr:putative Splicing factor U2AF 50 kDa subunit [Blattamonas nauphoetae]
MYPGMDRRDMFSGGPPEYPYQGESRSDPRRDSRYDRRRDWEDDRGDDEYDRHHRRSRHHRSDRHRHRDSSESESDRKRYSRRDKPSSRSEKFVEEEPRPRRERKRPSKWDQEDSEEERERYSTIMHSGLAAFDAETLPKKSTSTLDEILRGSRGIILNSDRPTQNQLKQTRRIYVGNIPIGTTKDSLTLFINNQFVLHGVGSTASSAAKPVVDVQVNADKNYAFVEFRTAQDATNAMSFNGCVFQNTQLKIGRPKEYVAIEGVDDSSTLPAVKPSPTPGTTLSLDNPNKLFIANIPNYIPAAQIKTMLEKVGPLKMFKLLQDTPTTSKGYGFAEYADPLHTDVAIKVFTNTDLDGRKIIVQRAASGTRQKNMPDGTSDTGASHDSSVCLPQSSLLVILNTHCHFDTVSQDDYNAIVNDMRTTLSRYGDIVNLEVTRANEKDYITLTAPQNARNGDPLSLDVNEKNEVKQRLLAQIGRVYVEYQTIGQAEEARRQLEYRQYQGRMVLTAFFSPERYHRGERI